MSFIRKIRTNGKTYLAEVENRWVDGKCVQKHIRYIGKEVDGETVLSSSLSDVAVDEARLYGLLLVLDYLAKKIRLPELLGERALEILALVYAHCLDHKSINRMEQWFRRTDLAMLLPLESVTEQKLLEALDSLEVLDATRLQQHIFENVAERDVYALSLLQGNEGEVHGLGPRELGPCALKLILEEATFSPDSVCKPLSALRNSSRACSLRPARRSSPRATAAKHIF